MGKGKFEYFDHTADVGMRVWAESLPDLLETAATGLTELLIGDRSQVQLAERRAVDLQNDDPTYLLFDLLNEMLYLFEVDHLVFGDVRVSMPDERSVHAELAGEPFDPDRHQGEHEVKAVTYHGLSVTSAHGGCRAEVIFDI